MILTPLGVVTISMTSAFRLRSELLIIVVTVDGQFVDQGVEFAVLMVLTPLGCRDRGSAQSPRSA